jgi:hypothetical protein
VPPHVVVSYVQPAPLQSGAVAYTLHGWGVPAHEVPFHAQPRS